MIARWRQFGGSFRSGSSRTIPAQPVVRVPHEQSPDPDKVLFHALGAWRIKPGFHDLIWNPAVTMAASQLLGGSVRFWHDQLFCKPAVMEGWWRGTRTIPTGRAPRP